MSPMLNLLRDQYSLQTLDDPLCGFAVPFGRNYAFFPLPRHQSCQRGRQLARIGPKEFVRPNRDGLGTFGLSGLFGLFGLSCSFG